jgi:hypothetical protein
MTSFLISRLRKESKRSLSNKLAMFLFIEKSAG